MTENSNQNQTSGQTEMDAETERRNRENETGQQSQQPTEGGQSQQQPTAGQSPSDQSQDEGGSGFVGSSSDQSSDYLTKGENQDFQPEGQGASDSDAGTADIETGQSTNIDSTLDDGSDTSR